MKIVSFATAALLFALPAFAKEKGEMVSYTKKNGDTIQISAKQAANYDRMAKCGVEWKSIKGTDKANGKDWRAFSSECRKRLASN